MKKRLLSALLAVVMVATLLPLSVMPAFATAPAEGEIVYYFAKGATFGDKGKDSSNNTTAINSGWYRKTTEKDGDKVTGYKYTLLDSGIVTSQRASGTAKWYSVPKVEKNASTGLTSDAINYSGITLLGDAEITADRAVNVALNGKALTVKFAEKNGANYVTAYSITVTDTYDEESGGLKPGSKLILSSSGSTVAAGASIKVSATKTNVSGSIKTENKMDDNGKYVKTYGTGDIDLVDCKADQLTKIELGRGTVDLINTVALKDSSGLDLIVGTSATGQSASSNKVTLDKGSSVKSVAMYGTGALNVYDTSNAGEVTLFGGSKADVTANASKTDNYAAPGWSGVTVTMNRSGKAKGIKTVTRGSNSCISACSDGTSGADLTTHTIKVDSSASAGNIDLNYANVALTGAGAGDIAVKAGAVTLSSNASAGKITLGDDTLAGKCSLTVSGDNTVVSGGVDTSKVAPANLTVKISGGQFTNGCIKLDNGTPNFYKGGGITGGTFSKPITSTAWMSNVKYEIQRGESGKETYTYTSSFAEAVSAYTDKPKENKVSIAGTKNDSNTITINFVLDNKTNTDGGDVVAFALRADPNTRVTLPAAIGNRSVTTWYKGSAPYNAGEEFQVQTADAKVSKITLKAVSAGSDLGAINGVTVEVVSDGKENTPSVAATIAGNTIKLSGAVDLVNANNAQLRFTFTTTTNKEGLVYGATYYDDSPKKVMFGSVTGVQNSGDLVVTGGDMKIALKGSDATFTVDCSGLRKLEQVVSAGASNEQVVTSSAGLGVTETDNLIKALEKVKFVYDSDSNGSKSNALLQAVNKALAGYTASSVNSAIANGQRERAKAQFGVSSPSRTQLENNEVLEYKTLKIQVYLDIRVTKVERSGSGASGSITLDITPKYRELVYKNDQDYVVASSGKSLDSALLKSADGAVDITLPVNDWGISIFSSSTLYAHHGDYVYKVGNDGKFTDLHGFSAFVIDTNGPVASVDMIVRNGAVVGEKGTAAYYYDNLATAVAEVADDGTVTVLRVPGSTSIPVTGSARQFEVDNSANAGTALTFTGANVTSNGMNDHYTVELTQDNAGTATVRANNTSANGAIRVSATSVKAGSSFTATLTPNTGYVASDVTVVCDKGTAAKSGSDGVYTITVPAGATTVTVTPVFTAATTYASITVSGSANGYATVDRSGSVLAGTTVTVTLAPYSGYRSISVTGVADKGTVNLTRQNDNQWTFTVPANATTVTLAPVFDQANGTMYADVLSNTGNTRAYFDAVGWGSARGLFDGVVTDRYAFNPYVNCSRAEMVLFLYRASGSPGIAGMSNPFKDVRSADSYYNAAVWASNKGIVQGYGSSDTFAPNETVTRSEAMTLLYRMENNPAVTGGNRFTDIDANAWWYLDAINWGSQNGIALGTNAAGTEFSPARTCSRVEIVTFLYRDKA